VFTSCGLARLEKVVQQWTMLGVGVTLSRLCPASHGQEHR
jgi:hypothetical protein